MKPPGPKPGGFRADSNHWKNEPDPAPNRRRYERLGWGPHLVEAQHRPRLVVRVAETMPVFSSVVWAACGL